MSRATVLVLEQNAAVQELIDQALCEAGHHVLGTNDAIEALDIVRRVRVDVLIAGSLPETRMEILLGELRSIQAELQVVSIDPGANGRAGLASPISLAELVEAVAVKSQRVSS